MISSALWWGLRSSSSYSQKSDRKMTINLLVTSYSPDDSADNRQQAEDEALDEFPTDFSSSRRMVKPCLTLLLSFSREGRRHSSGSHGFEATPNGKSAISTQHSKVRVTELPSLTLNFSLMFFLYGMVY